MAPCLPEGLLYEAVDDKVDGGVEYDEEVRDVSDDEDLRGDVVAPALVALGVVRRLHRQGVQHDEDLRGEKVENVERCHLLFL